MKPNISPLTITIYSIIYFLTPHSMLPDAALTLGLAAGMNVFAFCQPPREPGLDERPAQRIVGT